MAWVFIIARSRSSVARWRSAKRTYILKPSRVRHLPPHAMRSSNEYRVEKVRRPLQVHLIDGGTFEGDVFLRPVSRYRSRPEEPIHLLNDDEPYFAMMRSGEAILVAKASVARAVTTSQ